VNLFPNEMCCNCMRKTYNDVRTIIKEHNCKSYKDVQQHSRVGKGCGICIPLVQKECEDQNG
jgi:NAD(P)H-nitrite reductase large subunit